MVRIDVYLVTGGYAASRAKAQQLIAEGAVTVNGRPVKKPSEEIDEAVATVEISTNDTLKYVSRGGLKLEAALAAFGLSVDGLIMADIGASTGGFTDCLLQHGAARVFCIDAGRDQLAASLRADPRVCMSEQTNARFLTPQDLARLDGGATEGFDGHVDGTVMDVSFISQTMLLPMLATVVKEGGSLVSLIKPQFEVGRQALGKHGIVKRESDRLAAVEKVKEAAALSGFDCVGVIPSPIQGGDGNYEYIGHFVKKKV